MKLASHAVGTGARLELIRGSKTCCRGRGPEHRRLQVWALALDPAETRLMVGTAEQQLHVYTVQKPAADAALPLANSIAPAPKNGNKGSKRKVEVEDPEGDSELPEAATANRGGPAASSSDSLQILGEYSFAHARLSRCPLPA